MSVAEARSHFADVVGTVFYGQEPVIVERKGRPMVVMISPEQYERYQRQVMERFGQVVDELQELNAGKDPDEIDRDVIEAVTAVRREHYEREHSSR